MEKGKKIWMDGRLVNWKDANVHILTHTLHYGLGVFEGIRFYCTEDKRSAVYRFPEHTERLFASAHIAQMDIPFSQGEISAAIIKTIKASGLKDGYIRPLVYLGAGSMGIFPKNNPVKTAIAVWSWGAYLGEEGLKRGIRVKVSSFVRHHVNSCMTKAKIAGSYVNSILAKREVVAMGFDEALLLDTDGYVAEGSGENVFMVKDGILKTTPLTSVLKGITRDSVLTIAKDLGLSVCEERFTRDELYTADEAFFTGTAAEITPIREVDLRAIGAGKPGPVTKKIQGVFFNIVKGKNKDYGRWLTYV
ncbi:MAG: branched-chain amino acid transaminase [Deltaproteobacteria bacterium]|nr:branched-chain amino acid transaminase [Deltaproteobacteria bacterium]